MACQQAFELRRLVLKSQATWHSVLNAFDKLPTHLSSSAKSISIVMQGLNVKINENFHSNPKTTLNVLNLNKQRPRERKSRVPRNGPSCKCKDCGKAFYSPFYLNVHLANSSDKEACLSCGEILQRGQELKDHMFAAHGKDTVLCNECPLLFPDSTELIKHKKTAHVLGIHTCSHCGRTFKRVSSFEAHAQMHAVRTCRTCGTQFTNRSCYREHRSYCEPDAKPNTKLLRRDLRSNIRDPATYICDYCGKTYTSRPQLKNHIIWIHMDVRPFECQWCKKTFYTSARLKEHSIVHTRERNFSCDICGAKLVTKMALVYHKRRHTGDKPYKCSECQETFISASRRSEHCKRRHGKGRMFQCTYCPNHFVRSHELKKHVWKVHKVMFVNVDKNKINSKPPDISVSIVYPATKM